MKTSVKRAIRDEKGSVLILVLVLLVVGGLILTPLLGLMSTGLLAGQVYEKKTAELYAADAGVEDAIWRIQSNNLTFDEDNHAHLGPLTVNGRSVQVEIYREDLDPTCGEELTYQILSTAATSDGGNTAAIVSATTVEAYLSVSYLDFSSFLDNAIVSDNSITVHNGLNVTGNVTSGGSVTFPGGGPEDVDGTVTEGAKLDWPSSEALSAYYLNQVEDGVHYYGDTLIDIDGADMDLGPLYIDGELEIVNSNNTPATLTLTGTVYITGDTLIGKTLKDMTLDLNGQTIFVESNSVKPPKEALYIGGKCNIIGPGCIIAVGDVYFAPKGDVGSENDFVLVMSVEGTTTLRPSGTFYGCIAGNLSVDAQSGEDATIINNGLGEGQDLNLPMGIGDDPNELPPVTGLSIVSWEIK